MYGYKYPNWEPGMYYNTYQSSYPIRNPNQNYNYQQHHRRSLNNQNINYVPRQPRKNNYQCPENNNKTPPPLVKQKEVEKRKFDSSSLLNKTTISDAGSKEIVNDLPTLPMTETNDDTVKGNGENKINKPEETVFSEEINEEVLIIENEGNCFNKTKDNFSQTDSNIEEILKQKENEIQNLNKELLNKEKEFKNKLFNKQKFLDGTKQRYGDEIKKNDKLQKDYNLLNDRYYSFKNRNIKIQDEMDLEINKLKNENKLLKEKESQQIKNEENCKKLETELQAKNKEFEEWKKVELNNYKIEIAEEINKIIEQHKSELLIKDEEINYLKKEKSEENNKKEFEEWKRIELEKYKNEITEEMKNFVEEYNKELKNKEKELQKMEEQLIETINIGEKFKDKNEEFKEKIKGMEKIINERKCVVDKNMEEIKEKLEKENSIKLKNLLNNIYEEQHRIKTKKDQMDLIIFKMSPIKIVNENNQFCNSRKKPRKDFTESSSSTIQNSTNILLPNNQASQELNISSSGRQTVESINSSCISITPTDPQQSENLIVDNSEIKMEIEENEQNSENLIKNNNECLNLSKYSDFIPSNNSKQTQNNQTNIQTTSLLNQTRICSVQQINNNSGNNSSQLISQQQNQNLRGIQNPQLIYPSGQQHFQYTQQPIYPLNPNMHLSGMQQQNPTLYPTAFNSIPPNQIQQTQNQPVYQNIQPILHFQPPQQFQHQYNFNPNYLNNRIDDQFQYVSNTQMPREYLNGGNRPSRRRL